MQSLLELMVFVLLVAVCINFWMTLRIARIVREAPEPQDLPFTTDIGRPAPAWQGTRLATGDGFSSGATIGRPTVLVFLSSGCVDCRKRLPELVAMQPAVRQAGIELLVVGMESERRLRAFVGGTPLLEHVVVIDRKARSLLNPRNSSPFYLFIDDEGIVQASNFIGDRNWEVFVDQMHEYDPAPSSEVADAT